MPGEVVFFAPGRKTRSALDANPVVCGPGGCVAVDALVIPRRPA